MRNLYISKKVWMEVQTNGYINMCINKYIGTYIYIIHKYMYINCPEAGYFIKA